MHSQLQGWTDAQFPVTDCVIILNQEQGQVIHTEHEQVPPTGHTPEECTLEPTSSNQTSLAHLIVYGYGYTCGWIHG